MLPLVKSLKEMSVEVTELIVFGFQGREQEPPLDREDQESATQLGFGIQANLADTSLTIAGVYQLEKAMMDT